MPTAINPNDYNIDFFQTYSFGEITDSNYLNYLFNQNLQEISPELKNSPVGNFTNLYEEKGLEKTINYTSISNPGSIDEWLVNGNYPVNLFEISYQNPAQNVGTNQYGPSSLQAFNYENPELIVEDTGFIQYPTSVGGDVVTTLLSEGLDAVGISSTNFIDFDSPLNTVAQERRSEEAKNRIRDGIIENTVGRINLDPLGLLTGQPLFGRDYKITKPAGGILGGIINFASDVAGVNTQALTSLFGGPLPSGAFDWDSPLDDPFSIDTIDISETLLNRTGAGTKNLLFNSLAANKYGPVIEGQNQPINTQPKSEDSNQPTQKAGYLAYGEVIRTREQAEKNSSQQGFNGVLRDITFNDSPLTDKFGTRPAFGFNTANKSAKDITGNLPSTDAISAKSGQRNSRPDVPIEPTESDNPSITLKTTDSLKYQGFEFEINGTEYDPNHDNFKSGWDFGHDTNWDTQVTSPKQITTYNPERTPASEESNDGPEPGPQVWDGELFWKDGRTDGLPKRGLLNYTQKLINKSTNVNGTAARFIGLPNSDQNYDTESGDRRHITMSQGSLVKETKENKYYCRSWSVRNAYNKYNDLIRYDALWRDVQPGTLKNDGSGSNNRKLGSYSTLREPGTPKIAWEYDDVIENKIKTLGSVNIGREHIIPYMFSIENLAWKDAPQRRKLPLCEQGPHGGRIMWFPPYNINFTDNTSINWDTTNFIGRAEPIYTYNSTERTGTLSFTIIVDHPSIINKLKEGAFSTTTINENGEEVRVEGSANLETFFAGCSTEEVKTIVKEAFKEIIPQEDDGIGPEPESEEPIEFEIETPPEIKDMLSFHFKNATTSTMKETQEDGDKYANSNILSNSSCPDGIIGRCFDYNYETELVDWYDNPRLYKGGSNLYGSNGECPEGGIVISDFNETELVEIPIGGTPAMPITPPCNGTNFQPWGPKQSIANEIAQGNESNRVNLWSDNGDGYSTENYCCEINLTGFTSGSTTFTDLSKVGFYEYRDGANQRFWGTGSYPFSNGTDQFGKSPSLELPFTPEGGWKFSVNGDVPSSIGGAGTGVSQLVEFLATTSMGKEYTINVVGNCSNLATGSYNQRLGQDRADNVYGWLKEQLGKAEDELGVPQIDIEGVEQIDLFSDKQIEKDNQCGRWRVTSKGKDESNSAGLPGNDTLSSKSGEATLTPSAIHPGDYQNEGQVSYRRVDIYLTPNQGGCTKESYDKSKKLQQERIEGLTEEQKNLIDKKKLQTEIETEKERQKAIDLAKSFVNECDYFEAIKKEDSFLYESIADKLKNFHPAFHSITPEGFNERINFLQQCTRQGPSFIDPEQPQNTAFGRPPVCILRLGDFYFTKIIIDSVNFTFDPLQWDLNPEGIGVQPMLVNVDLNFKFIGGSTLQGPLSQLQNAVSYNFFANTAIYKPIEKILTSRGDVGQLITEGEEYYYGPWGSPGDFDVAIGVTDGTEVNVELQSTTTNEETIKEELVENKTPEPIKCNKGSIARKLTEEEINERAKTNVTFQATLQIYPLSEYDWWMCDDGSGNISNFTPLPKEESSPLNQTTGEDNTQTEEQQEQTSPNTTAEDGNRIFAETSDNAPLNISNKFGVINISGNAYRNNSVGGGSYFESGFSLLGGIIPHYVYGMLGIGYQEDYEFTITEIVRGNTLDGTSVRGDSNIGLIYDGNNVTNVPAIEASKQIVSFNLFEFLTGYERLSEWKTDYQNDDDFVIEDMESEIEKSGKVNFDVTYRVYANPTEVGKSRGLINQVVGDIKINGHLTADGVDRLKVDLNF
jgi:hypothetical protein